MTKMVTVNGRRYEFVFELHDGKAINGHFKGRAGPTLIDDLVAQYGLEIKLSDIMKQICDSIKLYYVTISETKCINRTIEVFGCDGDDAKKDALHGKGDVVVEHEINSDFEIVDCIPFSVYDEYEDDAL